MENQTRWQIVNPEGVVQVESLNVNPHSRSLDGKTVLLRWNGKHNGDVFLNRIAELLTQNVRSPKIIKGWEAVPETATISRNPETSREFARKLADLKPDIVIGSQGD